MSCLLAIGLSATPAEAEDFGNWIASCSANRACMYNGSLHTSKTVSSTLQDSNFANDSYSGGPGLNAQVENFHNRTAGNARVAHHINYGTPSTCIGPGIAIGPYPRGVSNGISSWHGC